MLWLLTSIGSTIQLKMIYNQETLDSIKRLAAAAYTPSQVRFALGLEKEAFEAAMNDENHPVCIAYFKGFLSSELSIREAAFKLARMGSNPAIVQALKDFEYTRNQIKKDGFTCQEI